ncbi:MAG: GGDEF domain-containing protein [Lachnospiraceae bacterium]|nr:GGDEF domain-containing protein [Lachnospiraceae bacterium]
MAVYVADFIGVLLLLVILMTKGWNLPTRRRESAIMLLLILATLIDCLVDPFVFLSDGKSGLLNSIIVVFGNSILYIYNLIVGGGMLALIVLHINKRISRFQLVVVCLITIGETLLLILNLFYPLVFSVDENNVYRRGAGYAVFIIAAVYLLGYALFVYFIARIRDDSVRYFPVWQFVIPVSLGVGCQTLFYGISTQPVSFAVAFCGLLVCLQNECIYMDKLTGVYNRYEFDMLLRKYSHSKINTIGAIMLDMNDFKSINDHYSHEEGDRALVAMANILNEATENQAIIIRYAGDEFVIILRKATHEMLDCCCKRISEGIDAYNSGSGKPYALSAAMGYDIFELGKDKGNDFLRRIDELMYENKKNYYLEHDRRS